MATLTREEVYGAAITMEELMAQAARVPELEARVAELERRDALDEESVRELEEWAAKTPEEIDAELRAAGVDLDEFDRRSRSHVRICLQLAETQRERDALKARVAELERNSELVSDDLAFLDKVREENARLKRELAAARALIDQIDRLREQLHLANGDRDKAEAEANYLREENVELLRYGGLLAHDNVEQDGHIAEVEAENAKLRAVAEATRTMRVIEHAIADTPVVAPGYEGLCAQRAEWRAKVDVALRAAGLMEEESR